MSDIVPKSTDHVAKQRSILSCASSQAVIKKEVSFDLGQSSFDQEARIEKHLNSSQQQQITESQRKYNGDKELGQYLEQNCVILKDKSFDTLSKMGNSKDKLQSDDCRVAIVDLEITSAKMTRDLSGKKDSLKPKLEPVEQSATEMKKMIRSLKSQVVKQKKQIEELKGMLQKTKDEKLKLEISLRTLRSQQERDSRAADHEARQQQRLMNQLEMDLAEEGEEKKRLNMQIMTLERELECLSESIRHLRIRNGR